MKPQARRRGQQVVEYLMLFAIVIVVLILFVSPVGPLRHSLNQSLNMTINQIDKETDRF